MSCQEGGATRWTRLRSNILSEMTARNSGEVANILQSRMMAALDEFKAAVDHAIPDKPSVGGFVAPAAVQPTSRS